ncbi:MULTISPECIES: peroxide-responsive transcriptional repressor PerR [Thermoactinomyces]|jgi:Fur family transcriptional regulator, peroxide stress response regulator|uniref:Peroxide-responsive transcriptional repressor PerR n=1 Tax=Thermoactinomyces daqus TaxID=1329516 RepID=A0A7W1XB37_9BACL|nr:MULTISPECIES: peroxide-responsive transcriptional repressor PerR [Thermoactinomyces]MBA4543415.1 peroxide-responsive transcriptional repressor PerR [Thermoactinomyces daqus]MBH8599431.1 peroxide-responsive transcriptional repressor PerR [Thermoactinomyces sp. CICC 10523]MBH8605220.1 peroxide-responsive transcriptional repressor PerR [Thermoactinomyces sp. CICC 10522]MBH8608198.1 peroxide-responsive transcriptional repressor PerR [Thermoactinomyces sp. CICC 10521]
MTNRLAEAVEMLKGIGVRMTPQRHAILTYLYSSMGHPTADEIYKALEGNFPNMSVATVYNNLRVFKDAGLVRELTYGDASSRFDANMDDHYHVICRKCGKITDFDHPPLFKMEQEAAKATGYQVETHRMEVYGVCPECQKKEKQ